MTISRQFKGPDERSIGALRPVVIFLLNFFFFLLFPFDCQRMIRKIDLNIVFINSRKLSLNYDVVFLFVKIHRRACWLHTLGSKPSFCPPRSHPPSKKILPSSVPCLAPSAEKSQMTFVVQPSWFPSLLLSLPWSPSFTVIFILATVIRKHYASRSPLFFYARDRGISHC